MVSLVNDSLSAEQVKRFSQCMFQLQSADQIAAELANELLQSDSLRLINSMQMSLSSVDVCLGLSGLLQQLNVGMNSSEDGAGKTSDSASINKSPYRLLFSGSLGLGALAESSRQMADLR